MSRYKLMFLGWPEHYIQNVYMAVVVWMEKFPDYEGTPVWEQMKDIRDAAESEARA